MRIKLFTLIFVSLIALSANKVLAQKDYTIKYELKSDSDLSAMMMDGATLTLMFKDDKAKVDVDMSMMKTVVVAHDKAQKGLMLMSIEMMGMRIAVPIPKDDYNKMQEETKTPEVRFTNETKDILGYKCKQAFVQNEGAEVEIWYTPKIIPANTNTQYTYAAIKGMPLEIHTREDGVTMTFTATSVSDKKINESEFSLDIPDGYEEMTMEELEQMGGGN